jgi:peptidoglycan/LPS O-acetylase OafA/YrhL
MNPAKPAKYDYIDAVRGWAILLVITCHVFQEFQELPYPVKRMTNFGWHGVQLFFIASALTLTMSWYRDREPIYKKTASFFLRRVMRIAPLYYCAALFYLVVDPPPSGFELGQLIRTLIFLNSWHPEWLSTTHGWTVVLGGWSVSVEFAFYAMFPILAVTVTNLRRAIALFILTVLVAIKANSMGQIWLADYDQVAAQNFLYYWFPNQAPVFAMGIILFFILERTENLRINSITCYFLMLISGLICFAVTQKSDWPYWLKVVPNLLLASFSFVVFIFAMAKGPRTIFSHPWIQRLGVLSFGSYLLHFVFVRSLDVWTGGLIDTKATGYVAIAMGAALWAATLLCTTIAAALVHRLIELPGINLARQLTRRRQQQNELAAA